MITSVNRKNPSVDNSAFVAPDAMVIGDVTLGARVSVWYGSVLRGDINWIRVGEETNIQDGCIFHVNHVGQGLSVGRRVSLGHRVILHACTVEDEALVGMGSIVLDRAVVGRGAMVAAGSVVPPGMEIPPATLAMGAPARIKRDLSPAEIERNQGVCDRYLEVMRWHRAPDEAFTPPWQES